VEFVHSLSQRPAGAGRGGGSAAVDRMCKGAQGFPSECTAIGHKKSTLSLWPLNCESTGWDAGPLRLSPESRVND